MRHFALALSLMFAPAALFAQDFSSLEERMSYNEFKAAGLDKLSPEELQKLNEWLRDRAAATLAAPAAAAYAPAPATPAAAPEVDTRGLRQASSRGDTIYSKIPGEFLGWSGVTRFRLENGQVWESFSDTSTLRVKLQNPNVRIEQGLFGAWYLKLDDYNATAKVKRIQ